MNNYNQGILPNKWYIPNVYIRVYIYIYQIPNTIDDNI